MLLFRCLSIQKDRTTAFAVSKFCCSRQVDGNPSSCHCRVSVYWQPVWQMGWAINTHPQCPTRNEVKNAEGIYEAALWGCGHE